MYHDYVTKDFLEELQNDAMYSLMAAQSALPLVRSAARPDIRLLITSAKRRLYLATSAIQLWDVLEHKKTGNISAAKNAMRSCIIEGRKLLNASHELGWEFPMTVHDDEVFDTYLEYQRS